MTKRILKSLRDYFTGRDIIERETYNRRAFEELDMGVQYDDRGSIVRRIGYSILPNLLVAGGIIGAIVEKDPKYLFLLGVGEVTRGYSRRAAINRIDKKSKATREVYEALAELQRQRGEIE